MKSEKWTNEKEKKPIEFDLVLLELENKKIKTGWWSGFSWCGFRLKPTDKILKWGRILDHNY